MQYCEYLPNPKLSAFVQAYFEFIIPQETKDKNHLLVPEGCVYLVYFNGGSIVKNWCRVLGPHPGSVLIPIFPATRYWGIRFFPGTTQSFFNMKGIHLRNKNLDLSKLNNELANILLNELGQANSILDVCSIFDDVFSSLITSNSLTDPNIQKAVRIIMKTNGVKKIREVTNEVGINERSFRRKFKELLGLTPKEFSMIRRLRHSTQQIISKIKINEVAFDTGFFDQSHFHKETFKLLGVKPTSFNQRLNMIKHEKWVE